jgi:hypothetical protein
MTGHWERDGEEFNNIDEMWDYIRDNEYYFDDVDFERWLNENFTAAQIVFELKDAEFAESVWLDYLENFEDSVWAPDIQDEPVEGFDYHYGPHGEFEFEWVEDEEEEKE